MQWDSFVVKNGGLSQHEKETKSVKTWKHRDSNWVCFMSDWRTKDLMPS